MASSSSQVDRNEVDIVFGALNAKLQTKNLSSGSSRCISFDGKISTPCEFDGKSSSRNWKSSIRCCGKPLLSSIEMCETSDGKKRCRFVTANSEATSQLPSQLQLPSPHSSPHSSPPLTAHLTAPLPSQLPSPSPAAPLTAAAPLPSPHSSPPLTAPLTATAPLPSQLPSQRPHSCRSLRPICKIICFCLLCTVLSNSPAVHFTAPWRELFSIVDFFLCPSIRWRKLA